MLIIVGSRRNGNCLKLANKIKENLEHERIYSDIIVPGNQKIHICTGCMDCDKNGICDFKDDMKENIDKIKKEEYIIFITPTRWNLISGDLKIFIDRLNPLYSRKELKNKKVILISIGSKNKGLYSTESSLSDLHSFAESAEMNCILDTQFYDCLNDSDICNQEDKINKFINELKAKIN